MKASFKDQLGAWSIKNLPTSDVMELGDKGVVIGTPLPLCTINTHVSFVKFKAKDRSKAVVRFGKSDKTVFVHPLGWQIDSRRSWFMTVAADEYRTQ